MKKLLEKSKYIILIPVGTLLLASFITSAYGVIDLYHIVRPILYNFDIPETFSVSMIRIMDTFLISIILFIFAIALYELFIENLDLPEWLIVHNLYDLETKLGGVIILVMAVHFLNHFVEWKEPITLLYFAVAFILVSAALLAFNYFKKEK